MKCTHILRLQLCSISIFFSCFCVLGQEYNYSTGTISIEHSSNYNTSRISNKAAVTSVNSPCNGGNTFWGFDALGTTILEYALTNGVIKYTGNFISNPPGFSLAICNNLNGDSLSPTFYSSNFTDYFTWNGDTNWIQNNTGPYELFNIGGFRNYLYSLDYPPGAVKIIKYDGTNYTEIITLNKPTGCADIAVDTSGNIYLITSLNTAIYTDSLYVISPQGKIIKQYAVEFIKNNAYGCFFNNNILYVGLGTLNPSNPNTLLPISFSGIAAIIGNPIPLPIGHFLNFDLASCILPAPATTHDLSMLSYPNVFSPNSDGVNDSFAAIEKNIVNLNCKIFNRYGLLMAELKEVKSAWDGYTTSGVAVTDGVYYYVASGIGIDDKQYELHGFILLVR